MSKFDFSKYKKGIITIETQSMLPEKFINLLWKNNINITNLRKIDITTMIMDVSLKDYYTIKEISKKTKTRIKIINRKGISFFIIKTHNRRALIGGIVIFAGIIYFLSTFIWSIDIVTEKGITPFELRSQLKSMGIKPGVNKRKIDVYKIEEKLMKENNDIMWIRSRIEGAKLKVNIAERQQPPNIKEDNTPCDIVAKKDGEIVRVYSSAGTIVVKEGDIVKKGDILIKGEQGKEDNIYFVHAQGDVIAKTFYESTKDVSIKKIERKRTGRKQRSIHLNVLGKDICLKKVKNNFKIYDKILVDKKIFKEEVYYELVEETKVLNKDEVVKETVESLSRDMIVKLDKSVKIVDKMVDTNQSGEKINVRVVLIVEENIAQPQKKELEEKEIEN
ncbi:sporulation protein YqfD [Clostridium sp. MB40-C1]|uniref:sporulation protein YqfD n=1 Tax=Clostridium sp. MB40-C1 TaxID=3070996 RepID=UPI0027DF25FD|nr:sporulation protein YqfD [Clostridium sp. MB40-C1]WMJ82308.1 sporulation protein YqfD [Clostridium sp. MB40-C1]